jgi:tetratricopeptide (TPR) repeat protein
VHCARHITLIVAACGLWLHGCMNPAPRPVATRVVGQAPAQHQPAGVSASAERAYERALAAMKAGQDAKAEALLLAFSREYPQLAGPYVNLGIIYYSSARLEQAEQALRHALQLNPSRADAYNHLGIVLRYRGRFEEARAAYEQALKLDANYSYAHLNLGILYDLYLFAPDKALTQYQHYQQLHAGDDQQVDKWIIDLKRRAQSSQKTAMRQKP